MADVLTAIVERKRGEVAARVRGRSFAAEPSRRSLRAALARTGARFIMEVKRASPSGHRSRLSVREAVTAYAPVADAISVLTDGPGFAGSLADLAEARTLFDGPILAKDFIVDPAQVHEARAAGADAVLAMMSVLEPDAARAVMAAAEQLHMDVIVEVHDEAELARALALRPSIIGINNRDLKSLRTDLSVTERLASRIPAGVLAIAESGIAGREDVDRLAPSVDAFLVGSALMAAADTGQSARTLVHGRVKLCGLTSAADVELAAAAGATHCGFILVPGTPRAIGRDQATVLAEVARVSGLKRVGVFRDAMPSEAARIALAAGFDAVQLHGREDAAYIARLRGALPQAVEIWAACGVNGKASPARTGADRTLFDTALGSRFGGTGRAFDWALLAGREDLSRAFLAGGIGPGNAKEAAAIGTYGLDVGSGVEAVPGVKDRAKVSALFDALRAPARTAPC